MSQTKWYHRSWQRAAVEIGIENLRFYVEQIESVLKKEAEGLLRKIEEQAEDLPEGEKPHLYDYFADRSWKMNEVLPLIHRNSILITVIALVENSLNFICNELRPEAKCAISLSDLSQKRGINLYKVYLSKVVGIDFPSDTQYWKDITSYRKIRNVIVHNGGRLDLENRDDHGNLKQEFIDKNPDIELDETNTIRIKAGLLPHMIQTVAKFFRELFQNIPQFQ